MEKGLDDFSFLQAYSSNTYIGKLSSSSTGLTLQADHYVSASNGAILYLYSKYSNIEIGAGTYFSNYGQVNFHGDVSFASADVSGLTAVWG